MRTSGIFVAKKLQVFQKLMVCSHGKRGRGLEVVQRREEGQFFVILCGYLL